MGRIAVRGVTLIQTKTPEVESRVDIIIHDDRIEAVGPDIAADVYADITIDGSGLFAMPGNVCSHHHTYSGLSRGILASIGPTPDFISVLRQLWWRLDRALDLEAIRASSLICSVDAIASGTTAIIDHHASPSCIEGSLTAVAKGMELAGIRGMTCYEVTDRNRGADELAEGIAENVRFCEEVDSRRSDEGLERTPLVEAAIGAHAPFTVPESGMRALAGAADRTGRGLHIHVAEDAYDVAHSHHHYGEDIVRRLDRHGLLTDRTILVHGLHLSSDEISLINDRGAYLAHNARSNMNNHVGYLNRIEEIDRLVLGTDGIGADMFEEMRFAYFAHKDHGGAAWPPFFLKALTRGNDIIERYSGDKFGRIAPGYKADIVLLDYRTPTPLVTENIAGHFIFGLGSGSVRTVIVNGKVVMQERKFSKGVEDAYQEAVEIASSLWKRMDSVEA